MYSRFKLLTKYIQYRFTSYNGRGHGMHSPFVYDMIRNVLMDKAEHPAYRQPELYRKKLLEDGSLLDVLDFGAGSTSGQTRQRRVSDITRTSVKHQRYSRLIYRLAAYYQCRHILEMGTSLGVTSSYLAQAPGLQQFVTMEGAPAIADLAEQELKKYGRVTLVRGPFDLQNLDLQNPDLQNPDLQNPDLQNPDLQTNLERALELLHTVDLAFIDGNHRLIPTLNYFETILPKTHPDSIIIFDDIHWSEDMEQAWEKIRTDERVRLSIDLFFMGIVFFRREFREKQHFTISF